MRQSFNIRLPAGKVWPQYESEQTGGGRQIRKYNWIRIDNRGNGPLYVDTKGIPNTNDLSEVWDIVPAGQLVVRNLGAAEDPDGWADELHILSPSGTGLALVEISDRPIVDIRSLKPPQFASSQLVFTGDRADFSPLIDDASLSGSIATPMASQFDPELIVNIGGQQLWSPTFGPIAGQAEFKTANRVTGLPFLSTRCYLPIQSSILGAGFAEFGFEASDAGTPAGFFAFKLLSGDFRVTYVAADGAAATDVSIAGSLPGTYNTALHTYQIVIGDDAVRWIIDGAVVFTLALSAITVRPAASYIGFWVNANSGPLLQRIRYFAIGSTPPGRSIAVNFPSVSALNTPQQVVLDLRDCQAALDILSVASAGTATLQVEVSTDNTNWTSIDTLAAALSQAKHYSGVTVGATVALCPLAFRFVRITAGAAGAGNTTTLTVSAK